MITYVDDLLIAGWQHHSDPISSALLAKYVMKRSGILSKNAPEGRDGIDSSGARITCIADGSVV